jgi:DnaJ domain/Tetratricopeptide repeat
VSETPALGRWGCSVGGHALSPRGAVVLRWPDAGGGVYLWAVQQIFVRDGEGKVYGPLEPVTVELLIDGGVLNGALLVSTDGVRYGSPARYPALKDYFPRHLWADDGEPLSAGGSVPVLAVTAEVGATPGPARPAAPPRPAVASSAVAPPPAVAPGPAPRAASTAPTAPGPLPKVTAAIPVVSAIPANNVVPSIPPVGPAAPRKTTTGSFNMAPPAARPTPAAGTQPVPPPPVETRFSNPAPGTAQQARTPTPPSVMPVPPRTTTPRPSQAQAAPSPGSSYMVASGDLAEISAIRLYAQAAETNVSGLFTFQLSDRSILAHFRKGNPEFIDSTHPEDAVDDFLSKAGVVTAEQLKVAEKEKGRFGGEVLSTLFALGLINPAYVFPALSQRAAALLLRAFLAPAGIFQYQPLELPSSKSLPLGNRWGFLAEVMRRFPLAELKRRMMDVRQRPLVRRSAGEALPDLRFTAQELRVLGYFDGTLSLALLAQSHPGEMETILRVALLLRELDALSFPEVELKGGAAPTGEHTVVPPPPPRPPLAPPPPAPAKPASTAPPRVVPAPTPPPSAAPRAVSPPTPTPSPAAAQRAFLSTPTPSPGTPVDFAMEIRMLRTRLEKGKSLNHFQILGLSDKADAAAVKTAYFKLAKLYHPDTVPQDAPPELADLRAHAFSVVGEASRVLGDDQSRADYLESLKAGGGSSVDVRQVLAAEDTFHKGVAFIKARRFVEAVKTLDDAITLNPREGEFYAWRGYARFFTTVDKKVSLVDAMRDLHHALKLTERCAPAHYLIGQLHKLSGDNTLALKHFKKCVSLDAAHVDALREVRLLTGR